MSALPPFGVDVLPAASHQRGCLRESEIVLLPQISYWCKFIEEDVPFLLYLLLGGFGTFNTAVLFHRALCAELLAAIKAFLGSFHVILFFALNNLSYSTQESVRK